MSRPQTAGVLREVKRRVGWPLRRAVLLAVASLACAAPPIAGGADEPRSAAAALRYRKVFVPEESLRGQESAFTQGEAYLPVRREEFDELLTILRGRSLDPELNVGPRLAAGTYTARYDGATLLHGTARLVVVQRPDTPGVVPLDPCNLVIERPLWNPAAAGPPASDPAAVAPAVGQAARIGCEDSGRLVGWVDNPGELTFDWSLRGTPGAAGEVTFDVRLPASAVSQLQLELPRDRRPLVERGLVTPLPAGAAESITASWLVQVPGDLPTRLTVAPTDAAVAARPLTLLRQHTVHDAAADGDRLTAYLTLDVYGPPIRQLTLVPDESLQLTGATVDGEPLPWVEATAAGERQISLRFPQPLQGADHEVVLQAAAPIVLGQRWKLPRLRLPDCSWQEGTTTLQAADNLLVDFLETSNCRQTGLAPLTAPRKGEAIEIQDYHAGASASVVLRPRNGDLVAQTGTAVRIGPATTHLVHHADITALSGPCFLIELEVSADWTVDQVATQPAELLEDWSLPRRSQRGRVMQVRLKSPCLPGQPLRLTVQAHRRGLPSGSRLAGSELRFGTLRNARVTRRLVALAAEPPRQIRVSGDTELTRLAFDKLTDAERGLLSAGPSDLVFVDDAAADGLAVSLGSEPIAYAAEARLEVLVSWNRVQQTCHIRCTPKASRVERVTVYFSESPGEPLQWRWQGADDVTLQAQRPTAKTPAAQPSAIGEVWDIALSRPQEKPFEIVATLSRELQAGYTVPFVALPRATSQVGYVTVRAAEALPLEIQTTNLKAVPPELPAEGRFVSTLGSFRYDPSRESTLRVAKTAKGYATCSAWAWSCRLDSRIYQDGRGMHEALYRIENRGRPRLTVTTPNQAELLEIRVDGQCVPLPSDPDRRSRVDVPLPREVRFPAVAVRYLTVQEPLGPLASATVPWPGLDLPTFERRWVVWLPPAFAAESPERDAAGASWSQRLFGPLLRSEGRPPFAPWRNESWAALLAKSSMPEVDLGSPPVDVGALQTANVPSCWQTEEARTQDAAADAGWTATAVLRWPGGENESLESLSTSVRIVRTDVLTAAGWAAFLAACGLLAWVARSRIVLAVPLTGLAGIAALLVADAYVPLFTGGFLGAATGTVLALAWLWTVGVRAQVSPPDSTPSAIVALGPSTVTVAVLLAILLAGRVRGAEAPADKAVAPEASKVYRVLYPIDAANQPVGPYVFVPRDFYSALRRSDSSSGDASRQWLIDDALYRAIFAWDVAEDRLVVKELLAEYRLQTYGPQARVVLPITQDQVYLLPQRARLDGQPASVFWAPDGSGLVVETAAAGEATLQLAFQPRVEQGADFAKIDVRIPRVPTARARVQLPPNAPALELPRACGGVQVDPQTGERVVALGPADRLLAQWPSDPQAPARATGVEVEQLLWLRLRPGSVALAARFKISCLAGTLREFDVLADPRWRLLPPADGSPLASFHETSGSPRTIRLALKPPHQQQATVDAEFVLSDTSGIGALHLPRLEAVADRTVRRWLAVSVDPTLQLQPLAATGPAVLEPASFVAAWGQTDETPACVLPVPDGDAGLTLATRPREPQLRAAQRLDVVCGVPRADLEFTADIETAEGLAFQYWLRVPAAVAIESLSVVENGDERVAGWSRDGTDRVAVRLKSAAAGKQRLRLRGSVPWSAPGEQVLPRLSVVGAEPISDQTFLHRRPPVLVSVTDSPGFEPLADSPVGQHRRGWGRLVAGLGLNRDAPPDAALHVTVSPNRPKTRGSLLIALHRAGEVWQADAEYELKIDAGVVDTLRLDIPAEWTAPFEVAWEADQEIIDVPGAGRRQLVIRPRQPVAQACRVRVRGTLSVPPGEPVRVPDIMPLDVDQVERYVVAPRRLGQQTIAWDTIGLQETSLPGEFTQPDATSYFTYTATQPHFQAAIRDVQPQSGEPGVTLADIHIACRADGSCVAVATFDLRPAGLTTCDLELPKDCRLIHAAVDGVPALPQAQTERRWRLRLGPPQLAQQIQLVFTGRLSADLTTAGHSVLPVPKLARLPVSAALWTVQFPDGWQARLETSGSAIATGEQELLRFRQRADLVEGTSSVLAEIDPTVTPRVYLPWLRRLAAARTRSHLGSRPAADAAPAEMENRYAAIVSKVNAANQIAPSELTAAGDPELSDVWEIACGGRDTTRCSVGTQGLQPVEAHWLPPDDSAASPPWAAVALLGGVALLGFLSLPYPLADRRRSVAVLLTLLILGVAWWLWGSLSILGCTLAATTLAVAALCTMSRRSARPATPEHK